MSHYYTSHEWIVPVGLVETTRDQAHERLRTLQDNPSPTHIDKQHIAVLREELQYISCPICDMPASPIVARMAYREVYDECEANDNDYACPCCGVRLKLCVPFLGPSGLWKAILTDQQIDQLRETTSELA